MDFVVHQVSLSKSSNESNEMLLKRDKQRKVAGLHGQNRKILIREQY